MLVIISRFKTVNLMMMKCRCTESYLALSKYLSGTSLLLLFGNVRAQGGEHEFLGQPFDGLFIFTFLSPLSLDPVNDQFVCRVRVPDQRCFSKDLHYGPFCSPISKSKCSCHFWTNVGHFQKKALADF